MPSNHAETAPDHPRRELRDRRYDARIEEVVEAARAFARSHRRWRFIAYDPASGRITLEHDTPIVTFTDDVVLVVRETASGTTVSGSSRARVGSFDLWQNARNLRQILRALDRRLT